MQNNSLIRVFGVLFAIVSIYQLSFTFITSNVENQASTYASQTVSENENNYLEVRDKKVNAYLDSIGNNPIYGFTSYNDAKEKELNKGLDLKGGINVILQISIRDILSGLTENTKNPQFNEALDLADQLQKSSDEPYIESFFEAFDQIKSGEKLASPDIFANRTLSDEINFEMTDQDLIDFIALIASQTGTKVEVVSGKTEHGVMLGSLGNIAAILRYNPNRG